LPVCLLLLARPVLAATDLQGDFTGQLGPLTLNLHFKRSAEGTLSATLDSPNQGALGIPCADIVIDGNQLSFKVPSVGGAWTGAIEQEGTVLAGQWTQGSTFPLKFNRGTPQAPTPPKQPTFDPALAPVTSAAEMERVLRRDLERSLKSGNLAADTGVGVSIGIVFNGERRVFAVGAAQPTSLFEIGSITKTMTGLMLAQMSAQGQAQPGQALRELLPAGTVPKPAGEEISLLDLVTHRSGLPRMPDNFAPKDPANPYADYGVTNLYQFLSSHGVQRPAQPEFAYSNLGFGLLGQALANRAGVDYPKLLEQLVLTPLCMRDTAVVLDARLQTRFIQGHSRARTPAHAWDLTALAGAGAVRSTADDMLSYLAAQLTPDKTCVSKAASARTLPAAIRQSHELQAKSMQESSIGFAWMFNPASGNYWHNGATGGYSSFALFNPKGNYAAVVLTNLGPGMGGSFADSIGGHLSQRFAGKPALTLD
jgi:CubicO group peptidase (beta-lactamase class C family)